MQLNRAAVEAALFELARRHAAAPEPEAAGSRPLVATSGPPRDPRYWKDFVCEPRDKLLQAARETRLRPADRPVQWEYLCNETNVLDRVFKIFEYYRNPEVGQSSDCLWECVADQLQRVGGRPSVSAAEVRSRCLLWMRDCGENYAMGPECSLPVEEGEIAEPGGTRCTLGQYVAAANDGLAWSDYVAQLEAPGAWADVLCLFAVAEALECQVFVCSKTFPYAEFFCHFGGDTGPEVLLAHWQGVQFRSVVSREEWDLVYEDAKKKAGGIAGLDHRLYAGLLRYQDRPEEAIAHCELEVARDPKSLVGHHTWSIVLSDNFKSEPALQHYLAQLEICPEHPHSYNGVGTTLHDMRRYEDAIFFYRAQLHFNPLNKYSHLNMSLAYTRLKRHDDAQREHKLQLLLHPTDRNTNDYYLELLADAKKGEEGIAFFKEKVDEEPWKNDWRIHLSRAHTLQKEYAEAAHQLAIVLERNPNDCRALAGLAELFERNGYYKRAQKLLRKILRLFPRHPRARSFLGDCEVKSQDYEGAERTLNEQIKLFPKDSEAYARMAEVYAQKGDTREAIEKYKKSRAIDPTDSSSLFNIGLCYLELQDFDEARAYFQRHLEESIDDPISLLEVANTYYAQGDLNQSIRGYRRVLEVRPEHHDCRAWLAATLLENSKPLEAIAEYEKLIEMTGAKNWHYNISYIYLTLSEQPAALADPKERFRLRRLADIHVQLETGVDRRYVDAFYEKLNDKKHMAKMTSESPGRLTMRSALLFREASLPYGMEWSPSVHTLCSSLAKAQVRLFLLLCVRTQRTSGYPFPREIREGIIREILAPPSEGFVRSVLGPDRSKLFFDTQETVCFKGVPASGLNELQEELRQSKGIRHVMTLWWRTSQGGRESLLPLEKRPEDGSTCEAALYITFDSIDDAFAFTAPAALAQCHRLVCSPAELLHVPFEPCPLTRESLAPFEGLVGLYAQHSFGNRQQCLAAESLAGAADDEVSLSVAVSYALGDEPGVKRAIHQLLESSKGTQVSVWHLYNLAMTIYLLLAWVAPLPEGEPAPGEQDKDKRSTWERHFANQSEYAKTLLHAATELLGKCPTGEALFRMGVLLVRVATQVKNVSVRSTLLQLAEACLSAHSQRSPKHPEVLYFLGQEALLSRKTDEALQYFELCSTRELGLGHMEACRILMEQDKVEEAFRHLEQQVAISPSLAYAQYADCLFRRLLRLNLPVGKERKKHVEDIKRFYDVHSQLREVLTALADDTVESARYEEFLAWDASQPQEPPHQHQRVEFVPRVDETPFGVADDFEDKWVE